MDTKIHPRPRTEDAKFEFEPGSHHRPSRRRRIRSAPKTRKRYRRRVRDSGKPGDPSDSSAKGKRSRGNPETHPEAGRGAETGATWRLSPRLSRKVENPGETRRLTVGKPEGVEFGATRRDIEGGAGEARRRGNPELGLRSRRRMRESGQLETPSPAQLEDSEFGATRRRVGRLNGTMYGLSNLRDHRH